MFLYCIFSQPEDLARGHVILVLETQNLPFNFMEKVLYLYSFISSALSMTQFYIYSGVSHA